MKVILGSVVKGFTLKQALKAHLEMRGHEIQDVGCYDTRRYAKFSSIGERIARALTLGEGELAVNCCGSGTGASIAAGKFRGVCAVSCESVETARAARLISDANCLCLGESTVSPELACRMADAFIEASFQDIPDVNEAVLKFWREARDELAARGDRPEQRDIEYLDV